MRCPHTRAIGESNSCVATVDPSLVGAVRRAGLRRQQLRRHLRRVVPGAGEIRRHAFLRRVFGKLLFDIELWHLNRASVAGAVSVGLFMAWVPVPFQMILAAGAAISIRCNLPVAVALVWISNPVTAAPMYYGAYELGGWLLDVPPVDLRIDISLQWLLHELGRVWEPFLLGCFVIGIASAILGHVAVRLVWRAHVMVSWRDRRIQRGRRNGRTAPDPLSAEQTAADAGGDAGPKG